MPYHTRYSLEINSDVEVPICEHNLKAYKFCPECGVRYETIPSLNKIKQEILSQFQHARFGVSNTTWYDHEEQMKFFSLKYPDILFTLHGEGEDSGDVWMKYFKAGKMQVAKAKITFDEFDERSMK